VYRFTHKPSRPQGPARAKLAAILDGRVGAHRVLTVDADTGGYCPGLTATGHPCHGLTRGDTMYMWYEFHIKGHRFVRRFTSDGCGNMPSLWCKIAGQSYQISSNGERWTA
jgi:hypothetical protein